MGLLGIPTWMLFVCLSWLCVGQVGARTHYMVAVPAVIEAGSEARFCASLLWLNETTRMIITLNKNTVEASNIIYDKWSREGFHECHTFQAPMVSKQEIYNFEVEIRGGAAFPPRQVRKIIFKRYKPFTFIQTDRPIYSPGQEVQFRIMTLDTNLRSVSQVYSFIEIEDPKSNCIGQWQNQTCSRKVLQLSYKLNSEAQEGIYNVIVIIEEQKIYHTFKVEKYVLPKFDVKINTSDEVCVTQEKIKIEVCATYTYGQPVPDYLADTRRKMERGEDSTRATGGISHVQKQRIVLSYEEGRLEFIDVKTYYEKGSIIEGKIKAVYYNQKPAAYKKVYLFEGERWSANLYSNLTTDSRGIAKFQFNTYNSTRDIRLHANTRPSLGYPGYRIPYFQTASHQLSLLKTASPHEQTISYLEIKSFEKPIRANSEVEISIHYTFVGEGTYYGCADVVYLILAKGKIVMQGYENVDILECPVTDGKVTFKLKVTAVFAPEFQVVAYVVLPSLTVIAHKADFLTEKFFAHEVFLDFMPPTATPGEVVRLLLKAEPYSLCGLTSVDQSVYIKEPGKPLDANVIYDLLPLKKATSFPYEIFDPQDCVPVRPKRSIFPFPGYVEKDTYMVLRSVGLKMATSLIIRTPDCLKYKGKEYYSGLYYRKTDSYAVRKPALAVIEPVDEVLSTPGPELAPIVTIRKYFPETWLFHLEEVGPYGKKELQYTVPDTVTTWWTDAFCLSNKGFGLAPRHELLVFQPFFIDLTLPYSIIRGEAFELKATVFNFHSSCIMVTVTPAASTDYTLNVNHGDIYTFCLCGNERKTVRWSLTATSVGAINVSVTAQAVSSPLKCGHEVVTVPERGHIDVITRSLIVEPEGCEIIKTFTWLLLAKAEGVTEELEISLPTNMIQGSGTTIVSVVGDIMGRTIKNLEKLLQLPSGCGEQNIATLAPDVFILKYLTSTNQLTLPIKERALKFLITGYQRQLNYKHQDGSFSAFGTGEGNTWLTAFVLKTFFSAKDFIFIDPDVIKLARIWLEGKQKENGCFKMVGRLFNNKMKGGVDDEVTLTAYITAGLLKMDVSVNHSVVKKSLCCLKKSIHNYENTYTIAMLAYVYTLAADYEVSEHLIDHLERIAITQGDYLYWSPGKVTSTSLSIEIAAYVLLTKISKLRHPEDLTYASRIVRWLKTQQNPYGGFSSTQDTVVALEALSLYSSLVYKATGSSTVTVSYPRGHLTFEVNDHNVLLYQEKVVKIAAGTYHVLAKGTRTVSVQIVVKYHIPTPKRNSNYQVVVQAEANCDHSDNQLNLTITSKYTARHDSSNMVILDIKLLSGFLLQSGSMKKCNQLSVIFSQLKNAPYVGRVDTKGDHIVVYLKELKRNEPIQHSLQLTRSIKVDGIKPAVVMLYDYYDPEEELDFKEYTYPCQPGNNNTQKHYDI
ncbi:alpha-2-macroglobulin-like [Thalassophryne amazonica]|uniref:alpha-2-macroglobulin-like n=1 Tax=Thalassophryne amazonica TaxID=390379 RepID=UPI0014726BB5|nr:alpha-2-macroglobulin-like [Thalassophryne amazonica]